MACSFVLEPLASRPNPESAARVRARCCEASVRYFRYALTIRSKPTAASVDDVEIVSPCWSSSINVPIYEIEVSGNPISRFAIGKRHPIPPMLQEKR